MKPSERIAEIAQSLLGKVEPEILMTSAIAIYLDEQHEAQHGQ